VKYSGNKLPPLYVGSTSIKKLKSGYRGSVTSIKYGKIFEDEIKTNPHLFEYEVLSEHETRGLALEAELNKQTELDVVNSDDYFNESLASVDGMFGRDVKGEANPMYGKTHSESAKKEMSEKRGHNKRYNLTKAHKEIVSKTHKGKEVSEYTRSLISKNRKGKNSGVDNPMYGKKQTEETKDKISKARTGQKMNEETKDKISKARTGQKMNEETKDKISKSSMGRIVSKETRDKLSKAAKGKVLSDITRMRISKSNMGKKMSAEAINNYKKSRIGMKYKSSKCPHCGKVGGGGNMLRYHFDNCKLKVD